MKPCLVGILILIAAGPAAAGEFNPTLNIGDPAPAWNNLDGTDGNKHSLADLKDKPVVVVVFTCNSCPIAVDYEDRIIAFANQYAPADARVALVAINVNTIPEDRLPKMTERAAKKKFPFAYLYDPTQDIAKQYGARYTPEFFVLNAERKIVYMGAMDDRNRAADATVNYLQAAVTATLAGRPVAKPETLARGCRIRWNRAQD
jgi:peroxiredoxin